MLIISTGKLNVLQKNYFEMEGDNHCELGHYINPIQTVIWP
jgi:hypothetical protein